MSGSQRIAGVGPAIRVGMKVVVGFHEVEDLRCQIFA